VIRTRILTLAAVASLTVGLLSVAGAAGADDRTTPKPTRKSALSRLHATTGSNPGIFNESGARVLLSSVNVLGLGEYYQANPDFMPTVPVGESDFEEIARRGFNSVRLVLSWSALEPTRGAYDEAYVARIKRAVSQAAASGLYVVLDMHQDAWGIAVDTPEGETCPEGTEPSVGWDGAPAWATITDGATTCHDGERELVPAVRNAWQHFYDNTNGIQTRLVQTWARLAGDFATNRAVAGYDLLNEPGIGSSASADVASLGTFYGRTITAIRKAERKAGGFSHIAFFEPGVLWSALGSTATPQDFTRDKNIVFAPHIYAEGISHNTIESGFAAAATTAASYGVTVWVGEWGFFSANAADDADKLDRYTDALDQYGWGGAWWSWKQACGNPHVIHAPGGLPDSMSPSLIRYSCPSETRAKNPAAAYAQPLFRPLPRAVPGRITKLKSDGRRGTLDLAGTYTRGADRCSLRVFVPNAWADKRVRAQGIDKLRRHRVHGTVVLRGCVQKKFRLRIG
jgi:endoglycosylceramidase